MLLVECPKLSGTGYDEHENALGFVSPWKVQKAYHGRLLC